MRIAVNTRFLLKNRLEGIGRFTYEVLKRMVIDHPEDEFLFFFDRKYSSEFIFAGNITPVVIDPPARHPILFFLWFEIGVRRALKKCRADVFLSTDNFTCLSTKIPNVLVMHDVAYRHFPEQVDFLQRLYYQYFTPRFLEQAHRIVSVSDYTKNDIVKNYGTNPDKIAVACNGCDRIFQPASEEEKKEIQEQFSNGKPYFVYVGAIHPRKNVANMLRGFFTFKTTTESDTNFLIVGRKGWMNEEVATVLQKSKFKDSVIFTGYVKHESLPKLIGSALAMVYVSLFEGFGIPILEAMHCEVPVITADRSSMPEVGGPAALYSNPESPEDISRQMRLIYENRKLRKALIEKGKIHREKFSWEKASQVVYKQIQLAVKIATQKSNY